MQVKSKLYPITCRYIGILGLYYLFISIRVIIKRIKVKEPSEPSLSLIKDLIRNINNDKQISIDPNKYDELSKEIRSHLNFNEYVPIVAVLSIINELNKANGKMIHSSLLLLLIGRIFHHIGMIQKKNINVYRSIGIISTYLSILINSLTCIYQFK